MKDLKEYMAVNESDKSEQLDRKLTEVIKEYAEYYDYDAEQTIASLLWFMQMMCQGGNPKTSLENGEKALKTWKEEFLKAQDIVG